MLWAQSLGVGLGSVAGEKGTKKGMGCGQEKGRVGLYGLSPWRQGASVYVGI